MVTAYAQTNIALVKYWGKRPNTANLPAVGSVSMTLDAFGTETTVVPDAALHGDAFVLDGQGQQGMPLQRVTALLDLVRKNIPNAPRARVSSRNDVPTAAGLASSASAFAALALAASRAYDAPQDVTTLASVARQGSGSAARSVLGGFVVLHKGVRDDGADCVVEQVAPPEAWEVRLLVAQCASGPKDVASTLGMNHTQQTSPFYNAWVETHPKDMEEAVAAVRARDLARLGDVMEFSTLKMHASGMAARPGVLYWRGVTVEAAHAVRALRAAGTGAWFTMDAGPHVKVLCSAADAPAVAEMLASVPGVLAVKTAKPGPAARVML